MNIYFTLGDTWSGIYASQVIDVILYLNQEFEANIQLVAFIPWRNYLDSRQKILEQLPDALVYPSFPKNENWKFNRFLLWIVCSFLKPKFIISRGVFATNLALINKSTFCHYQVCFDARGAYAAEWNEYFLDEKEEIKHEIPNLERMAVLQSDFRIAVSQALVNYWNDSYSYSQKSHVVIPCTLSEKLTAKHSDLDINVDLRQELGYSENDIILVYAGSLAGWQSIYSLEQYLNSILQCQSNLNILFLSKQSESIEKLTNDFPDRVKRLWLSPNNVHAYLSICDYGILLRDRSLTNTVSSPTKFAEYLYAGIPVLISSDIGDYSKFVADNRCGIVVSFDDKDITLKPVSYYEKQRIKKLAQENFTKSSFTFVYKIMIIFLNSYKDSRQSNIFQKD